MTVPIGRPGTVPSNAEKVSSARPEARRAEVDYLKRELIESFLKALKMRM